MIKKIVFVIVIFCFTATISYSQQGDTVKVLFIGNSFTNVNNLPNTFYQLASSAGKKVYVEESSFGGYTLQMHSQNSSTIQKIYSNNWDYVVLQEQSQIPSFIPERETMMYPYAITLDSMIHNNSPCTRTVFFMTWAHKYGDQGLPVGSDTYENMQQRLRSGYMTIADTLDAAVAPCGWAWRNVIQNFPNIELYSSDNYHPAENGTYLAACTFYACIFKETPVGINYYGNVLLYNANVFQNIASQIVLDSLNLWNIGLYNPNPLANFTSNPVGLQVQFTNSSTNSNQYLWNFGDGTYSTQPNPVHDYTNTGIYMVQLIAKNSCSADTINKMIQIISTGIGENENYDVQIYPNPNKGTFTISIENNMEIKDIEIYHTDGKQIQLTEKKNNTDNSVFIETNKLKNGIYYILLRTNKGTINKKLIII